MNNISSLILAVLLSLSYCYGQDLPLIQVQGNQLVDEEGTVFQIKALNSSDPDKLEKEGQWKASYFKEMKEWGANTVRFPIHPRAWRERGTEAYMKLLDEGMKLAEAEGLYVILDWHSIGNLRSEIYQHEMYNTSKRETFEFWRTMALKYGSKSTVICFELFNEPTTAGGKFGTCTWKQWKDIVEEIIIVIRANGAKNIPLVAGFNWAYDLRNVKLHPIAAEGIAYVSHPYPQKREKPWFEKWTDDWGYVAEKYPLVLTEIGFCGPDAKGAHIPVISDETYVEEILQYTKEKGISFAIWVFDPLWSPMLIENWDFTPTLAGEVWKKALQSY